jgi:hypothetical protein
MGHGIDFAPLAEFRRGYAQRGELAERVSTPHPTQFLFQLGHRDLAHLIHLRERAQGEEGASCVSGVEGAFRSSIATISLLVARPSLVTESDPGAGSATRKPTTPESHAPCHAPATVFD